MLKQGMKCCLHVAVRPGKRKILDKSKPMGAITDKLEQAMLSICVKVEQPFQVKRHQVSPVKVQRWGQAKGVTQEHGVISRAVCAEKTLICAVGDAGNASLCRQSVTERGAISLQPISRSG